MWTHGWCKNLTIVTKEKANEKLGVPTEPPPESLQQRGFTFVQWGFTFWNLNKHHCFIVLHISIVGTWSFVSEGLSPPKPPPYPWRWHCVAKFQLAFKCNWFGKVFRLRDMSSLQDVSNFLFISMTVPKVVLQPLGRHCVECAIHHERDMREELQPDRAGP